MRRRITTAFVALALAVMVTAGAARAFTLRSLILDQEHAHLQYDAQVTARVIDERIRRGVVVNRRFLADMVEDDARLSYDGVNGHVLVVRGADYRGSNDPERDVSASAGTATGGTVTFSQAPQVAAAFYTKDLKSVLWVLLLVSLGAGLVGWWAARRLSAPFLKLAEAASHLGRGRFDLNLPRSRMPEVQAIARALQSGAAQLAARVTRERQFAEHASHQIRTPLTSLRLELEDLALRDDVPTDVRTGAERCLELVARLDASAGELVSMARRGSLVEGAEVPLPVLATQITQRWSDLLGAGLRDVSASAEGELTMLLTPGPVEHILDLVLRDVQAGAGPVRLTFIGGDGFLRVKVAPGAVGEARGGVTAAREVAEQQGGRITGDGAAAELELILPRR